MEGNSIQSYTFFKALTTLPVVDEIWLYGSRARGDHRSRSDIDLAVICPRASMQDWLQVLEIIDEADTLLKIDCVRFDTLQDNNPLKAAILRDAVVLFKKQKGV